MKNYDSLHTDSALREALRRIDNEARAQSFDADFEARLLQRAVASKPRRLWLPWLWASAATITLLLMLPELYHHVSGPTVYRDTYASVDEVYLHHCTDPKTQTITIQL